MSEPHVESDRDYRVPSQYRVCRGGRGRCPNPPVMDLRRTRRSRRRSRIGREIMDAWYAYCAEHLRVYNREVRGDQVWWLGTPQVTA